MHNTEVCPCNFCCSGKAIIIAYSEGVFVALGILRAMRMRHVVIMWPVRLCGIFSYYLINGTDFGGKQIIEHDTGVLSSCTNLKHFSFKEEMSERGYKMYIGLCVNCRFIFVRFVTKFEFYRQFFGNENSQISNFTKNPSSGSRVVPFRHDETNSRSSQIC